MTSPEQRKPKQFLFVDDDTGFLDTLRQVFLEMACGSWEILTAANHAEALAWLQKQRFDLVVVDLELPVMDGVQFLRLLARTQPGQQVAVLTGHGSEEKQRACLENGAVVFLEKATTPDGFATIFATLDALTGTATQEGFHGVMRRVGLQEVLQMECLGRKSSVLEISTVQARGQVFICDGSVVHAQCGSFEGEEAFYRLLSFRGGRFNLQPYSEPAKRTISGQYEFLLMEAARLADEMAQSSPVPAGSDPPTQDSETQPSSAREVAPEPAGAPEASHPEDATFPEESSPVQFRTEGASEPTQPESWATPDSAFTVAEPAEGPPADPSPPEMEPEPLAVPAGLPPYLVPSPELKVRIQEVLLASVSGEVLYDWQCQSHQSRTGLLERLNRQATHLGGIIPAGSFQSLEIQTNDERIICLVQPQTRLFMRRTLELAGVP
jgi:CheY-like chemotaxis protein